jgi:electron transfer flavoprotein alpha/beta subunit
MQRGVLRAMIRYPLVVLVEEGRLSPGEAGWEMGLSALPAVLAVEPGLAALRYPRLQDRFRAQRAPIQRWSREDPWALSG